MKKAFCLIVCLVMIFSLLPISTFATEGQELAGDVWDGSITQPTTLVQKDGVYYYEITKCSELAYVAQTGGDWANYNYMLGNNLILNDVIIVWDSQGNCTNGTGLQNWTPINNFSGEFDGNGYYISGLYINSASGYHTGLFGYAYNGATIKNVDIKNAYVFGSWSAGGVVGEGKNIVVSNSSCSGIIKTENSNSTAEHGCGGICGYLSTGTISDCVNYAQIVADCHAGGVCGRAYAQIDNCANYGDVVCNNSKQSTYLGGIAGRSSHISGSSNFGCVSGGKSVGGITGFVNYTLSKCKNEGQVCGTENVGGIAGEKAYAYTLSTSINSGSIIGEKNVGGIVGKMTGEGSIMTSVNLSCISGEIAVGGIVGYSESIVKNCYGLGVVVGEEYVGGICGKGKSCRIDSAYNANQIIGLNMVGGIIGSDGALWNTDEIANCYYLKNEKYNTNIYGCGNNNTVANDVDGINAKTERELKTIGIYDNWNFQSIWSIEGRINGGYPYLQWQESAISDNPANEITLDKKKLSIAQGDSAQLTAFISPANALDLSVNWISDDNNIAFVTQDGKVTAVAPGTATVSAITQDGNHTATCDITVTERNPDEYYVDGITVSNKDGVVLKTIPKSVFTVALSIANRNSAGNATAFLATYTANGRFVKLVSENIINLPKDDTCIVRLSVDNLNGDIALLKAFIVPSFSYLQPIGNAVTFPAESQ